MKKWDKTPPKLEKSSKNIQDFSICGKFLSGKIRIRIRLLYTDADQREPIIYASDWIWIRIHNSAQNLFSTFSIFG